MRLPKLTKSVLRIMEVLWTRGLSAIREVQEEFPSASGQRPRPSLMTIYRLKKKVLRRVRNTRKRMRRAARFGVWSFRATG